MVDTWRHPSDAPAGRAGFPASRSAVGRCSPAANDFRISLIYRKLPPACSPYLGTGVAAGRQRPSCVWANTKHRGAWFLLELPVGLVEACGSHIIVQILTLPSPVSCPLPLIMLTPGKLLGPHITFQHLPLENLFGAWIANIFFCELWLVGYGCAPI